MHYSPLTLSTHDAQMLHVNHWFADQPAKAVVLLAHGMAEHSLRYAKLAEHLLAHGVALYGLDQRGHGQSANNAALGHYADHNGWEKVVEDIASLRQLIKQRHPTLPVILLGHSMGSYIAQAYLMKYSHHVQGAILCGSNYQSRWLYRAARILAGLERWRLGPTGRSQLINRLSFGSFNQAFKPNRTEFDWLSRDAEQVDLYVTDPLCGFVCTTQMWCDFLDGLVQISSVKALESIRADLPVLIIGGEQDPVSAGVRLKHLAHALSQAGLSNVSLKIYPKARHELFNESNRAEVFNDLTHWLLPITAVQPTKECS